jgi:hypothetical protein
MADLPVSWVYLMFIGGFGTCAAQALCRRDVSWALAFGMALLLAAEQAGISPSLVAWGIAAWSACAALFCLIMIARIWEIRLFAALGLIAGAALLTMPASAGSRLATASLHFPPGPAVAVEAMLRTMFAFR